MDLWLETESFGLIYIFFLAISFSLSIQDIAVNSWTLTLLPKEKVGSGATVSYIGIALGTFISFNLFTPLNSSLVFNFTSKHPMKYHEKYELSHLFYATPKISHEIFLWGFAIYCIILGLINLVFIAEKIEKQIVSTYKDVVQMIPDFYHNDNLRKWIKWNFLKMFGISMISGTIDIKFLSLGFDKNWLVEIDTIILPLSILVAIILTRYAKYGQIMRGVLAFLT